jgi:hypothetical protein
MRKVLARGSSMIEVVERACEKGFYCNSPLSAKKTKKKVRESLKNCLGMRKVFILERRRLFSKRAGEYMVAYIILDSNNSKEVGGLVEGGGGQSGNEPETKPHMTAYLIEKIVRQYKSSRSAADSDAGFINGIVAKIQAH